MVCPRAAAAHHAHLSDEPSRRARALRGRNSRRPALWHMQPCVLGRWSGGRRPVVAGARARVAGRGRPRVAVLKCHPASPASPRPRRAMHHDASEDCCRGRGGNLTRMSWCFTAHPPGARPRATHTAPTAVRL